MYIYKLIHTCTDKLEQAMTCILNEIQYMANEILCHLQWLSSPYIPGFCPHWSEVVGPNHYSAFLTTTQATFTTNHIVNCNTKINCYFYEI